MIMTTGTTTTRSRRLVVAGAFLLVPGLAISLAAWIGGEPYLALVLAGFYVLCGVGAYMWSAGKGDLAAIMRVDGDERQKLIDARATIITCYVVLAFCVGGAAVDLARGGSGNPWALICAVGGVTYAIALAVIHRRN